MTILYIFSTMIPNSTRTVGAAPTHIGVIVLRSTGNVYMSMYQVLPGMHVLVVVHEPVRTSQASAKNIFGREKKCAHFLGEICVVLGKCGTVYSTL